MIDLEMDTEICNCPACSSSKLIRVHRHRKEKHWLKAKYFCQNCGARFVVKRAGIQMIDRFVDSCVSRFQQIKNT